MARIETTGGDVYYTIPNCDCDLTGGCEKCQPFILPLTIDAESFLPLFNEQWKQQRLQEIRKESHRRYGKAWQKLANI